MIKVASAVSIAPAPRSLPPLRRGSTPAPVLRSATQQKAAEALAQEAARLRAEASEQQAKEQARLRAASELQAKEQARLRAATERQAREEARQLADQRDASEWAEALQRAKARADEEEAAAWQSVIAAAQLRARQDEEREWAARKRSIRTLPPRVRASDAWTSMSMPPPAQLNVPRLIPLSWP